MSQFNRNAQNMHKTKNQNYYQSNQMHHNGQNMIRNQQKNKNNQYVSRNQHRQIIKNPNLIEFTPMTFYKTSNQNGTNLTLNQFNQKQLQSNRASLFIHNQSKQNLRKFNQLTSEQGDLLPYQDRQYPYACNYYLNSNHIHNKQMNKTAIQRQNETSNYQNNSSQPPIFYSYEELQQNLTQYHPTQSQQSLPYTCEKRIITINNQGQAKQKKHLKYKRKYLQALHAIQKLQKLNETLINDQRKNYSIFQNTITQLEDVIQQKQQQIFYLNQSVQKLQKVVNCIQTTQYLLTKQQYQSMLQENRTLRIKIQQLNIFAEDISRRSHLAKTAQQSNTINTIKNNNQIQNKAEAMNSKIIRLKKHNQSLIEKSKQLQQTNKLYQNMLSEKEKRVQKLSQFNSSLSKQILKLKNQSINTNCLAYQNFSQVSIYSTVSEKQNDQFLNQYQKAKEMQLLDTFNPTKTHGQSIPLRKYFKKAQNNRQVTQIYIANQKKNNTFKKEEMQQKSIVQNFNVAKNNIILKKTQSNQDIENKNNFGEIKLIDRQYQQKDNSNSKYLKELFQMKSKLGLIKKQVYGQSISLSTNSK